MKAAAQVGLFVVIAVVLFLGAVFVVGREIFQVKHDVYTVVMPDAGGLAKGARVLMAGVQVGEVGTVAVDTPTQAKLTINLKAGTKLPLSTRALIAGSLVGLGDTPLSLVQDPRYRGPAGYLDPGMTIIGGKAGPLDAILPDGGTALYSQFTGTLGSVRKLLENGDLQKEFKQVLATANGTLLSSQNTLRAFTRITTRGDALLAQNQGQINAILKSTQATLLSVQSTAVQIERYARSGKLQNGADSLLADAKKISGQAQTLLASVQKTLDDPKLNTDLKATADNLKATSDRLPALLDKADAIAANVQKIAENSQELPKKLGDTLDGATDLEKRLGGLTDKVGGVFGKGGARPALPRITSEIDLIRESDPGHLRTDLNVWVPLSDGFVTAGLWDAFERNRVNLQLGKRVGRRLDYRYGLYAARPGVGVDYAFTPKFGLRGDLWDLNDPRLDARLRVELGGGLIGWVGADRIFRDTALTIGVGVRR